MVKVFTQRGNEEHLFISNFGYVFHFYSALVHMTCELVDKTSLNYSGRNVALTNAFWKEQSSTKT